MPTHDPQGVHLERPGAKASGRTVSMARSESDGVARSQREHAAERAITRFLHSFRLLTRSVRLYQPDHPRIEETLVAAERELRAAQQWVSPLEFTVEPGGGGRISAVCAAEARSSTRPLLDPKGELAALASDLLRNGITALTLHSQTNVAELAAFAGMLAGPATSEPWTERLAARRIAGIRINETRQRHAAEALVPALLASALLPELPALVQNCLRDSGRDVSPASQPGMLDTTRVAATNDECLNVIRLLARLSGALQMTTPQTSRPAVAQGAQGVARAFAEVIAQADRQTATLLAAASTRHEPHPGEGIDEYFGRAAQSILLEFLLARFRAGSRTSGARAAREALVRAAADLAGAAAREGAGRVPLDARWSDECYVEYLNEMFWMQITGRERTEVLRGAEAWCIPPVILRHHLESVDAGEGRRSRADDVRSALLHYTRCLALPDVAARRATAAGLSELISPPGAAGPPATAAGPPLADAAWAEMAVVVARALAAERAPEVAALLAGVVDTLAGRLLSTGSFETIDRMLGEIEKESAADNTHLAAVRKRLLRDDRWQTLVTRALESPRESGLARILARQPERLADDLGARLVDASNPAAGLPEMARLVEAAGEPMIGTLVTRLLDPRSQRASTAAKLLLACAGGAERLLAVLPRALPEWDWNLQDLVVSELARQSASAETSGQGPGLEACAEKLLEVLPHAHHLVVPMVLDQIGLAGLTEAAPELMHIAGGHNERHRDVFTRIKAIEALGRMRVRDAAPLLRTILRQRNGLTHAEPAGIRAAAEEALALIENLPSSARVRTLQQAAAKASASFASPRRYLRIPLDTPLQARMAWMAAPMAPKPSHVAVGQASRPVHAPEQNCTAKVRTISLGGAFLESNGRLRVGDSVNVEIRAGLRKIRGTGVVRNVTPAGGGVEFVHMKQEDREKLRKLVARLIRK